MPYQPMVDHRAAAAEKHLDLTAQDAAFRPATVKQKVKQWQGDGGGVLETPTPPREKHWSPSKSPMQSPASAQKKEQVLLHKEPRGPLLPEGYEPNPVKPIDIIRDAKTGAHIIVKPRSPSKSSPTKTEPATWDAQRKVFVRKKETKLGGKYGDDEIRLATSPKKRVISDGHWRKDSTTPKQASSPRQLPVTEPNRRIITQKSTPDFRTRPAKPSITSAYAVRKAQERPKWMPVDSTRDPALVASTRRARSRSNSRERGNVNRRTQHTDRPVSDRHSFESDSTERPLPNPRTPRRTIPRKPVCGLPKSMAESFSVASPGPDDSISRVGVPRSEPRRLPSQQQPPRKLSKSDPRQVSRTSPAHATCEESPRRSVPAGRPAVYGNRIEAWLGGQGDPFWSEQQGDSVEDRASTMPSPIPEPLRPRKRASQPSSPDTRQPLGLSGQIPNSSREQDRYAISTSLPASPSNKENGPTQRKASYEVGDEEDFNKNKSGLSAIGLGINMMRREAPTTGKALSTIASVMTQEPVQAQRHTSPMVEVTYATSSISLTTIGGGKPAESPRADSSGLKRRLTKHDDLMTVLSIPTNLSSLVSARSFRKERLKAEKQGKEEVLQDLATDEAKYQRELQTLVDGVIPVLLSNVLSKSSPRSPSSTLGKDEKKQNATQPIVDMGVALERLKTQHKRMPQNNPGALLVWAQNAAKVYDDYIKAWRMGFDDVSISVPKDAATTSKTEQVDVTFLLKRPLVRVKNLTKTFRAINHLIPSPDAEAMSDRYHALMLAARRKSNDELVRIEDEAAASIDPTRARDPKSLAPLAGVRIDASRSVRARDFFDLNLRHSTGQQLDCAIEVIIRDNEADPDKGGDVLFCEVSDTGRWLLFPPMIQEMVSARRGKSDLELVMMLRGVASDGSDWSELMTLCSSTEDAVDEWAAMLGDGPVPPSPTQTEFTLPAPTPLTPDADLIPAPLSPTPPSPKRARRPSVTFKSRTPSPKEVEIPIGEQARKTSKRWSFSMGAAAAELLDQATPRVLKKVSGSYSPIAMDTRRDSRILSHSPGRRSSKVEKPGDPYAYTDSVTARDLADGSRPALNRSKTVKSRGSPTRSAPASPRSDYTETTIRDKSPVVSPNPRRPSLSRSRPTLDSLSTDQTSQSSYSVWMPSGSPSHQPEDGESSDEEEVDHRRPPVTARDSRAQTDPLSPRPAMYTRTASTPSAEMPSIPRQRGSGPSTPVAELPRSPASYSLSDLGRESPSSRPQTCRSDGSHPSDMSKDAPSSAPGKLQRLVIGLKPNKSSPEHNKQISPTPSGPKSGFFTAANLLKARRSSSPLKREYDPAAEIAISDTDSEDSFSDLDSLSTHSSDLDDDDDELADNATQPTPAISTPQFPLSPPPQSIASVSGPSLGPSNSASQGPYRSVPTTTASPYLPATRAVATISSWSERGSWDLLHPVEVTVVVTAGLIEAFTAAAANSAPPPATIGGAAETSSPSTSGVAPLVAFELTPLVPLRRGTALDISIRSPPTAASLIRSSSHVMFRSRSADECERLYGLINQARISNATFIALQNARPHHQAVWAAQMDRRNAARGASSGGGWFGGSSKRGSTYRSGSVRNRSSAVSVSSVGTMNTAFSALRRLSGTWRRGGGTTETNSDSLESGCSTPNNARMVSGGDAAGLAALGIKELKVRLYRRENKTRWRDMGSARLTVMLPDRPDSAGGSPGPLPVVGGGAKRVLVRGATHGETMLDVTLGEGAFERVARTGIAVSVWRDNEGSTEAAGRAVDKGGVGACFQELYMVQMKSERDAAYTFGLVGKLRY